MLGPAAVQALWGIVREQGTLPREASPCCGACCRGSGCAAWPAALLPGLMQGLAWGQAAVKPRLRAC